MKCFLWHYHLDKEVGLTTEGKLKLLGNDVASHWVTTDEHDVEGIFFVFEDLSIGTLRLVSATFSIDNMARHLRPRPEQPGPRKNNFQCLRSQAFRRVSWYDGSTPLTK